MIGEFSIKGKLLSRAERSLIYMEVGDQKFISRISDGLVARNTEVMGDGRSAAVGVCWPPNATPLASYSIVSCSVSSAMLVVDEAVDCIDSLWMPSKLLSSQPLKRATSRK